MTSELSPFGAASDLGALSAALPKALRGLDHHVTVVSPLYGSIDPATHGLARRLSTLPAVIGDEKTECALYDGRTTGGVDLHFIGHERFGDAAPTQWTSGDGGDSAALAQALLLGQAAATLIRDAEPACDLVHAIGLGAGVALACVRKDLSGAATTWSPLETERRGMLDQDDSALLAGTPLSEAAGDLLTTTLAAAGRVVVASPRKALAIASGDTSPHVGKALADRSDAIVGIIDGVDAAVWNPLVDPHLPARFDPADVSGKALCKGALQYEVGLPVRPETPIVATFTGSAEGEALAQVGKTINDLARNEVQVVVAHDGPLPADFEQLCEEHDDAVRCMQLGTEAGALHRLLAGADFAWLPGAPGPASSLHLAAQRYGAVPVVGSEGVTGESIVDCDGACETGTGFLFEGSTLTQANADAALSALQRGLSAYASRDAYEALQRRSMRADSSWERAARRYEHVYRGLAKATQGA